MIIILISVIMDYGLLIIVRHWIMIIILISVCECKWQRLSLTFRFVNDNDNDYHLQGPQIHRRPRPRALGTGENGIFTRAIVCCDGLALEAGSVRCEVWGDRCEVRGIVCDGPTLEVGSVRQWVWHSKWVVWGARGVWNCERRADARGSVRCEVWSMECEEQSKQS